MIKISILLLQKSLHYKPVKMDSHKRLDCECVEEQYTDHQLNLTLLDRCTYAS